MKERRRSWADLSGWQIDRDSASPLFRQVYHQVQSAILAQSLRPGTKLPSTREMASLLSVSRSAVVAAYEQLMAEGYVCGRAGSGTYVSPELSEFADGYGAFAKKRSIADARTTEPEPANNDLVDVTVQGDARPFNLGRTLIDARTAEAWRRLGSRTFRALEKCHFGYSDPRGLPEFRVLICEYLRAARGVRCEPDQILVTGGTQHAIDLVIRVLKLQGSESWVEDPGYSLTRHALAAAGVTVRPVPVDAQGVDISAGIRSAPNARAVFVTPSHQFPTGVVLSMPRRLELLAWAQAAGAWIVEDDYASEFRYEGRPLASLQGLDDHERVIYVGTLNKALFPGLRLGYAVVPPVLMREFVLARYLLDRQPSTVCQVVAAQFMQDGQFAGHIRRMRLLYRVQRDALVSALRGSFGEELTVEPPNQGMHLVAYLNERFSDVAIENAALRDGVIVRAMSQFYAGLAPRPALVLGFSGYPRQLITPAVSKLAQVMEMQSSPCRPRP